MSELESQENELLAMQSIYNEQEFVVEGMDPPSGRIIAEVRLPDDFYVRVGKLSLSDGNVSAEIFEVAHLPPINLVFQFSKSYPLQTCPAFFLSCNWLTLEQLSLLCKKLEALWEINNDAILYTWMQFLQENALACLNIAHCLDITDLLNSKIKPNFPDLSINDSKVISYVTDNEKPYYEFIEPKSKPAPSISGGDGEIDLRAVNELAFGSLLIQILKDYNSVKMQNVFNTSYQDCKVCELTKQGSEFLVFNNCKHFFCKDCVKDYYEIQIRDGNVNSLKCLETNCEILAKVSTVKEVIRADVFEKYEKLLLSSALDSMPDVAYCPRKECQCACIIHSNDRMGTCPACRFIFCPFCMMTYHGIAPCNFKTEEKKQIFVKFTKGNAAVKKELEKRYGKRFIKSLVEDTLSENWKNSNSKCCPHCRSSIEKTDGCNKMKCNRCDSCFCWLCGKLLKSSNPYEHYSDRNTECYQLLFPGEYNDFVDDQPEENWDQELNVQIGEYLNQNQNQGIGLRELREYYHQRFGIPLEENSDDE